MGKKALIVLAEGFEETEAVIPIDILRRVGVEVTVAGLGDETIKGSHGLSIKTDVVFENYLGDPDVIILPGGMPGAENLVNSVDLKSLIIKLFAAGKIVAAICASPALVLVPLGVLEGKSATCFPGLEKNFPASVKRSKEKIIQDGNLITACGAGIAFDFGLKIAENLVGRSRSDMIAEQMCYS